MRLLASALTALICIASVLSSTASSADQDMDSVHRLVDYNKPPHPTHPAHPTHSPKTPAPVQKDLELKDGKLFVNGERYNIKGVGYSPVPIGHNPLFHYPNGDYFLDEFHEIWERDFPRIVDMGANTLRLYTFDPKYNHTRFLDYADSQGLKVIITYYLGVESEHPVETAEQRQGEIDAFLKVVGEYHKHPAVLAFTFGNEMNGAWNGFLDQFSKNNDCGWTSAPYPDGCYYPTGPGCKKQRTCMYAAFLGWINEAGKQAKELMGDHQKLITTSFADVDWVHEVIAEFDSKMTHLDAWGVQLYRGDNFGLGSNDFLGNFYKWSDKPVIVTEYGVDAYNDACGYCDGTGCPSPCYNTWWDPPMGFGVDEITHADWNGKLTRLIKDKWDEGVLGGCIMSWVDEYWKNSLAVKGCVHGFGTEEFDPNLCDFKGHVYCPSMDSNRNALCGYFLQSTFDQYVNEGWFGINQVTKSESGFVDRLTPRTLFYRLQSLWRY